MPPTVLIVEDTHSLAMLYQSYLMPTGVNTLVAHNGAEAKKIIGNTKLDLIILDVVLPDINGLEILESLSSDSCPQVIVLTGNATKEMAIRAIKLGASDFIEKPVEADRFRITVHNALKIKNLKQTVTKYKNKYENGKYYDLVGSSEQMRAVYRIISSAAVSKATVFITGESGTGKELCARAVHLASNRAGKPFVALNCAAIPRDLIESEIFGHLKGAFTGAISNRAGAAGQADGGTLFLDELCEMDINLQSKLLRFIQTGNYQQVGSEKEIKANVRFICATNKDPLAEVEAGRFREDLYYRLHVIPIEMPPLRDRGNDIVEIAEALFIKIAKEEEHPYLGLSDDVRNLLNSYQWPGNVRQLENVIRNILVLNQSEWVDASMLPSLPRKTKSTNDENEHLQANELVSTDIEDLPFKEEDVKALWLAEKDYIERVLNLCATNIPKAASLLDVSPSTLYRKIKGWEEMEKVEV